MKRRRMRMTVAALALGGLLAGAAALAQTGGGFDLSWSTIDSGGGASTSSTFSLAGTAGQPDASQTLTSSSFSLNGGFWPGAAEADPCAADLNGDGLVDGADLGLMLQAWDPAGPTSDPADLNGDGAVDGADLGLLLQGWGACP